jgi:acetyl-CoA carboxylase carboxyltransferase component
MTKNRAERKLAEIDRMRNKLRQGGGPAEAKRQHARGKLTARRRIHKLVDPGTFQELDIWGTPLDTESIVDYRKGPADAVAVGYGEVSGRPIYVWAQDATVLGGTLATMHARKITMVMEKALHAMVPIVGIIDSEGPRLQDVIQHPRFYSPESMVFFQTMSSGVIPQISLVMGPCMGEAAISASLADFVFMVEKTSYMHLASATTGKPARRAGAPGVHAQETGCCDVLAQDDSDCLDRCRTLLSYLPSNNTQAPPLVDTGDDPDRREEELLGIVPFDSMKAFGMHRIISLIADNSELFEVREGWARNLITGFVRLGGHTVGIVANNPEVLGGSLTLDAADKMAGFVRFCDAFNIAVVWLADTPAFLPAVDEETRGLIRHGCKVVFSNAEAAVPQITVAIRKSYGGGGLAMPGITLGGDLDVAWPTVERGLMGNEGAVAIIYKREREWAQEFIDPRDTRPFLINALRMFAKRREERPGRKHENMRL